MTKYRLRILYQHYLAGTLTSTEYHEWQSLLANEHLKQALEELVEEGWYEFSEEELLRMNKDAENEIFTAIIAHPQKTIKKVSLWKPYAVAASIIIIAAVALYQNKSAFINKTKHTQAYTDPIKPGGNNAYLTLSNGKRIALNDIKNGVLAMQSGVQITKTSDGKIIYTVADQHNTTTNAYNTIETPKGGQYQINLPDGSSVWLNSASSLKYPAVFKGKERKVELIGEAYFEISKDKKMPFKVYTANQEIEVLGTHFNVNSYPEEADTKTTLLEGSVRVSNDQTAGVWIIPGQQARLGKGSAAHINVVDADIEEVMAWKNNYFRFNDEKIETIMRKISRWYDVDIQFEGKPSNEEYNGTISRSKNIQQVLDVLESTQTVHFKIEGRRVVVMK